MNPAPALSYEFRPLVATLRREGFSCGEREIDKWFRNSAWDYHTGLRCRVTTAHAIDGTLLGFYACSITLLEDAHLERQSPLKKHSNGRFFPTLEILYVAVQQEEQNRGVGTAIMAQIVGVFRDAASTLGVPVMTLRAINERAARLYSRMGFNRFGSPLNHLMLLPAQSVLDLPPPDEG